MARRVIKAYRIGSYDSNSFKSSNPFSAINEVDISNTLDNINCGYPGCNQGGMAIVEIVCDEDIWNEAILRN